MAEQNEKQAVEGQNEQVEAKNEVTTTGTTAVATVNTGSNYISMILEETKRGFVEANAGLDMDFVRMGDWLTHNKKGNFIEKDNEEVSYGETIDVVVGYGEQRWSLWGSEGSPEDGVLIVAEQTKDEAEAALGSWLMENPQAAERYTSDDIALRYMAYVVPVESLGPDDYPTIYLMSFSPTDTIIFGRYAYDLYKGKYKALKVPPRIGVNKVVTRLTTVERKSKSNASQSWIGVDFSAVGVFNPEDYGINPGTAAE